MMAIAAVAHAYQGRVADLSDRFQGGDCAALDFRPKLNLRLIDGVKRAAYPRLQATVTARPGDSNIAAVSVRMPERCFTGAAAGRQEQLQASQLLARRRTVPRGRGPVHSLTPARAPRRLHPDPGCNRIIDFV